MTSGHLWIKCSIRHSRGYRCIPNLILHGFDKNAASDPLSIPGSAHDIVETVREPFLVLDADLRVRRANRSFYRSFAEAEREAILEREQAARASVGRRGDGTADIRPA